MSNLLPVGYSLQVGSGLDRSLLLKFLQRTYKELEPRGDYNHLARTVDTYFSRETPLWWVRVQNIDSTGSETVSLTRKSPQPIACLWLGTAIDQLQGDRHTHVFLLYVDPAHRRKGIATALLRHAEDYARLQGDRQIGLQVFQSNQPALHLYQQLGFETQSLWMLKPLH